MGKTFQSNSTPGLGVTPLRKALGDVNTRHDMGGRQVIKGNSNKMTKPILLLKPPSPTSKNIKPRQEKPVSNSQKTNLYIVISDFNLTISNCTIQDIKM